MRLDPVPCVAGLLALGLLAWPQAAGAIAFLKPGLAEPGRGGSGVVQVQHRPLTIPEKVTRFHNEHVRSIRRSIDRAVGHDRGRGFDSHHGRGSRKGLYHSHGHAGALQRGRPRRGLRHGGFDHENGRGRALHRRNHLDRRRDRFEHRLDHAERRRIDREIGFRRLRGGDVRRPVSNPNVYRYFTVKPRHRPMLSP